MRAGAVGVFRTSNQAIADGRRRAARVDWRHESRRPVLRKRSAARAPALRRARTLHGVRRAPVVAARAHRPGEPALLALRGKAAAPRGAAVAVKAIASTPWTKPL